MLKPRSNNKMRTYNKNAKYLKQQTVKRKTQQSVSGCWPLCSFLSVCASCLSVSMLAVLPFCLSACISACMSVCAPGPVGLSQSADYTHDKPPLPACLAFWGFQALRIPSPGFLSPRLTPVLHSLLFFSPISLG